MLIPDDDSSDDESHHVCPSRGRAAHRALGEVFEPLPSSLGGGKGKGSEASSDSKHDGGLSFDTSQLMAKRSVQLPSVLYKIMIVLFLKEPSVFPKGLLNRLIEGLKPERFISR